MRTSSSSHPRAPISSRVVGRNARFFPSWTSFIASAHDSLRTTMSQRKVAVIGGGAWGLALAAAAARAESDVVLLSRRDLNGALPRGVRVVREMKAAAEHARLIILAAPSSVARTVARELGDYVDGRHYVVHGVRGLVHGG